MITLRSEDALYHITLLMIKLYLIPGLCYATETVDTDSTAWSSTLCEHLFAALASLGHASQVSSLILSHLPLTLFVFYPCFQSFDANVALFSMFSHSTWCCLHQCPLCQYECAAWTRLSFAFLGDICCQMCKHTCSADTLFALPLFKTSPLRLFWQQYCAFYQPQYYGVKWPGREEVHAWCSISMFVKTRIFKWKIFALLWVSLDHMLKTMVWVLWHPYVWQKQ